MKQNSKILIAGLAIIICTNVVALAGVLYNRSGEPDGVIELTERELGMPYRYRMNKENTGLGLKINCRVEDAKRYYYGNNNCRGHPAWLDWVKMTELGFQRLAFENNLPRKVYLVLEYNGAAHQRTVTRAAKELSEQQALLANNPGQEEFEKRVDKAQKKLNSERHYNSRLFAIDVGLDRASLRDAYPDSSQYILMQALVRPIRNYNNEKEEDEWLGRITDLLIDTINIPLEYRAVFEPLENLEPRYSQDDLTPRYKVSIAFGKRAEPWVISVKEM